MHLRYCLSVMNVAAIVLLLLGASKLEAQATSAAPNVFHLLETTIDDVLAALRSWRLTCRELVELYLNPFYFAFVLSTTTTPPFITQRTLWITALMSSSGFPSTAVMSAK